METARFDLTMYLEEGDEKIRGTIEYSADLFEERTVGRMIRHYETLLRAATSDPGESVSRLPMMGPEELDLVLVEWNRTEREYGAEGCIHELFESQVERSPDRIALIFEDERVSYRELNRRANQLAHYLRRLGVKSDSLVAISVERSPEMVVGLFAILKAGGAYVPLDPSYPAERLAYMLKDSAPVVVLTAGRALSEIDRTVAPVIDLEVDARRWTGEI